MTDPVKNGRAEIFLARHSFWLGLFVVALVFIAGAALTWRKWPELLGDFGLQLYIPWQLANGKVLYRDLFYFAGGPLSQYYHAALFKLFGPSFLVLIVSNLAITATMLVLIYQRFRAAAGTLTATLIALAVVVGFAFAQYTSFGNCNYLSPYSHELLHGLALSILTLALITDWFAQRKVFALLAAGFCTGLVALTKPDIFLALTLTLSAGCGLSWLVASQRRAPVKSLAAFTAAALVPSAGFFLFFLRTQDWRDSLRFVFFGWRPMFTPAVVNSPFYQWCLGLDTPFEHLRQTSVHFLVCGMVIIVYAALFKRLGKAVFPMRWLVGSLALVPLLIAAAQFNWLNCGPALPLLGLVTVGILFWRWRQLADNRRFLFPLLWSIFGILLLAKQGVFPRIWHTGFALAMPTFVSVVYLLLRVLPDFLEDQFQVPRRPMRLGALAVFILALDWIATNLPPRATLAVVPEGIILNYLSRHPNPTPYLDWNPLVFPVFDVNQTTTAFQNHAPDYIAVVECRAYEFSTGYFGSQPGYGAGVMNWIQNNYQPVALFGSEPLRNGLFGIKILKHQTGLTSTNEIEFQPAIH